MKEESGMGIPLIFIGIVAVCALTYYVMELVDKKTNSTK